MARAAGEHGRGNLALGVIPDGGGRDMELYPSTTGDRADRRSRRFESRRVTGRSETALAAEGARDSGEAVVHYCTSNVRGKKLL